MKKTILLILFLTSFFCNFSYGKKIRSSFKVEKTAASKKEKTQFPNGTKIILGNLGIDGNKDSIYYELKKISFAGYEKEANSSKETFLVINPTLDTITGFEVRIDYLDLQERMLHSRTLIEVCEVPPNESRKFDFPSWDLQHSYFYYLGNEPKKVATPFKVSISPISYWVNFN